MIEFEPADQISEFCIQIEFDRLTRNTVSTRLVGLMIKVDIVTLTVRYLIMKIDSIRESHIETEI